MAWAVRVEEAKRSCTQNFKLEHNVDDGSMVLRNLVLMIAGDAGVHFGLSHFKVAQWHQEGWVRHVRSR